MTLFMLQIYLQIYKLNISLVIVRIISDDSYIYISVFCCELCNFAVREWMTLLLPLAAERGVCIITNMGAGNNLLDFDCFVPEAVVF